MPRGDPAELDVERIGRRIPPGEMRRRQVGKNVLAYPERLVKRYFRQRG